MSFTYSFHRDSSRFVLLRAFGAVDLVMWSNAMRRSLPIVSSATMPVLLDVTDATEAPQQPHETWSLPEHDV
jgi:hypothetical protein